MLKFSNQSLIDFYEFVDIMIIDGIDFRASWTASNDFRKIECKNGVLTTLSPAGCRQFIINDSMINYLKKSYKCVLNPSKLQLQKLGI